MTFSSRRDVDFADFDFDFDANDARTGERETVVMVERNERAAAACRRACRRFHSFLNHEKSEGIRFVRVVFHGDDASRRAETKRNARTDGLRDAPGAR